MSCCAVLDYLSNGALRQTDIRGGQGGTVLSKVLTGGGQQC